MNTLLHIILGSKGIFRKVNKVFKGSKKDPSFYLGGFSVLLFVIAVLVPCFCATLSLNSTVAVSEGYQSLFLGSGANSSLESPDFLLVQNSSLVGISAPGMITSQVLGSLTGLDDPGISNEIQEYIVESGDSLWSIADEFGISLNTLLWANNLSKSSTIAPGEKLVILPVSGVLYHVKSGDTLDRIAQTYKGKTSEIISFNNLTNEGDIYIGDILVIPNGIMPTPVVQYAPQLAPIADNYLICPIAAPCRITQGIHFYNAIDFSHGVCGEPIYAAAGGQVIKVKLTNSASSLAFGGAGNTISIMHPNGIVTSYGHIAQSLVNIGDQVSQGQIIAYMGGQPGTPGAGKSTGCHVHFQVIGARNPFSK